MQDKGKAKGEGMKPLSEEQWRILRAISRGAMTRNHAYRWTIVGEPRPDRRERERLTKRGFIVERFGPGFAQMELTDKGRELLENEAA